MSNTFVTLWTVTHQSPLFMGFPKQEYWSGLPFLSPGDLLDSGIEPTFIAVVGRFFTTEPQRKTSTLWVGMQIGAASVEDNMEVPWKTKHIEKQRHYFANNGPSSQGYGFSSGHVWMWELDCAESWVPKNWCFWTVVLEKKKTLKNPLDCKEIKPDNPKGNQT